MSHSHLIAASSSSFQLIIDSALKAYKKRTGKDLLTDPLFSHLHACNSPSAILAVLQQQVHGLDRRRSSDDRLTKWLNPTIKVLYTFSATLEGVGLVTSTVKAIFAGVGVLLLAAMDVRGGQDTLVDVFERFEKNFRRLENYAEVPLTTEMLDTAIQIMVVVISILGIVTMEIKQSRMKNFGKKLIGQSDLEDALKRLDKLTYEEARMATAEVQRVTHAIDERELGVREQVLSVGDGVASDDDKVGEVINDGKEAKLDSLHTKEPEQPDSFVTSSGSSRSPTSNSQLIFDALAEFSKITGVDLSMSPFAAALEQSNSPEAILQLFQEREKAFKEYRDGNQRLINYLGPTVKAIQVLSGIMGEATVVFPPAKALFAGIDVFLGAAGAVNSNHETILELFECLGNFLRRLEIYTMIPPTPSMTDIIVRIMVEVLLVLALATKQVKQGRYKTFTKKLLYGESDSEIKAALQRLDRLTQDEARMTVAHALGVVHGVVGTSKVASTGDGKASTDSVQLGQDLVAVPQVSNKKNCDQLQQDVQHWLSPPDPSTNHNFVRRARHSGTTAWFFESYAHTKWKARGSLLWIYGKPGAGKTTLLSAIIQDIQHMQTARLATMAYYYFDNRDVKKQDCYGLLSSLISQLSSESDSCHDVLFQLYSDHTRGIRKPDIDALKQCTADMLSLPGQAPIYIIVDALDDCPNFPGKPSARGEVLELIEELVNLNLPNVHLCVASRPEMDIRMVLEPLTSLKISLHDESGQKQDIIEYIKHAVHSDRNMRRWKEEEKRLVIDTLSEKADGMFGWVVCQVDRLGRTFPRSIWSVLNDLPKMLDETYGRALLGIDEEKREHAQQLFRCLTVSIRPLRVEELAEILAIRFDRTGLPTFNAAWRPENAEEAVISACSSLIAIVDMEGSRIVQFSHFTVKEFLTSERLAAAEEDLSYYHIHPEPAHALIANACLSVLLQLDYKIDGNTIAHFPLAPYAARHWVDHAQFSNVSPHIQEVMERLFDPAGPHFAAWIWLYDIDRHSIEPMSTIHPTRPETVPLYYAALCGFRGLAEHLIAADSRDVNHRGGSHTTPLHAASVKGHLDVALMLLKNCANPNSRDDRGRTPLHRVSQGGQVIMEQSSLEMARLLVNSGADVNVADDEGWTPLHAAAQSGYRDIAELLLESGASLDVRNKKYRTPLHVSCGYGKLENSRYLIDRGSDTICWDSEGFIPLHLASRHGHVEVARLLLDHGADANIQRDDHWSALHLASANGHLEIVKLLVERGAGVDVRSAGFVGTL